MIELEWWHALMVGALFFGLGWGAGRVDLGAVVRSATELPRAYLRGLNYLLQGRRDEALAALSEAAEEHRAPPELLLAVAALRRERGEFGAAIAIHRALAKREELPESVRLEVAAELAVDFHRAGMLDRAETAYRALLGGPRDEWARAALVAIFESEREWRGALELLGTAPTPLPGAREHYAHLCCELAEEALAKGDLGEMRRLLEEAAATRGAPLRVLLLSGDLKAAEGLWEEALAAWQQIEGVAPAGLALVIRRLATVWPIEGRSTLLPTVRGWLQRHPEVDGWEWAVDLELENGCSEEAYRSVQAALRTAPSWQVLEQFFRVAAWRAPEPWRADFDRARDLLRSSLVRLARYACQACGFRAREHYWRCPACGGWGTFPPSRSLEIKERE
ncbi:MAG: hypothetical protein N2557_02090 [Hydrogenophilus sp.]|nr:hypothetical protein [Hydrogenophilus sp.]